MTDSMTQLNVMTLVSAPAVNSINGMTFSSYRQNSNPYLGGPVSSTSMQRLDKSKPDHQERENEWNKKKSLSDVMRVKHSFDDHVSVEGGEIFDVEKKEEASPTKAKSSPDLHRARKVELMMSKIQELGITTSQLYKKKKVPFFKRLRSLEVLLPSTN